MGNGCEGKEHKLFIYDLHQELNDGGTMSEMWSAYLEERGLLTHGMRQMLA